MGEGAIMNIQEILGPAPAPENFQWASKQPLPLINSWETAQASFVGVSRWWATLSAWLCASAALHYFERQHPSDPRPRLALGLVSRWLVNGVPEVEQLRAAGQAAARATPSILGRGRDPGADRSAYAAAKAAVLATKTAYATDYVLWAAGAADSLIYIADRQPGESWIDGPPEGSWADAERIVHAVLRYRLAKGSTSKPVTAEEIMLQRSNESYMRFAIEQAGSTSAERLPRWSFVAKQFGTGSGVAQALCRRFDHDPDEIMGKAWESVCPTCNTEWEIHG